MTHRRAEIINALADLFEVLTEPSEFPVQIATIQRRYIHWTALDQQGAIPALLLNYGDNRRKRKGGGDAEYASLGEVEEYLPFALTAVMKEMPDAPEENPFSRRNITDQVSDMTLYNRSAYQRHKGFGGRWRLQHGGRERPIQRGGY